MQGPFATPERLAEAFARGPATPERIKKLLWHARKGTRLEWARTLAAVPPPRRAELEAAAAAVTFRG
jgi:hypothetical protein